MNKHAALAIAATLSLVATSPAPASRKPCRDGSGKIVECPKVRKASPRCKDAQGRFVACPTAPHGEPATKAGPSARTEGQR